ncbi:hypothetical protein Caci_8202 [Catenulispora acidiphila DSM 44928]|uniref:Uncharacterized protein n=1 Tax=Catenulispora acidiphila (strain DSM 44928 / JCM 14897 / NBRC 102108 / NRRL B-24433 / ID139908) TaxID=479433 RepID=C7QIX5_CATAD|nr:hypothetical protein [Catenulispora acidiphila]ACU77025.1 hypothetical protein Caci_8202 [Catenulispora acidiphila DSM 44928]
MSLIVLASDKGSPGVTTTAVALAGVWPRRAILAECDPAGGDLVYRTPAESGAPLNPNIGMLSLATTARHGLSAHQLEQHVQRMHGGLEVVVGLATGDQSAGLAGLWPALGRAFDALPDTDVIADCGRVDATGPALELMAAAALVVLVARTSAEQIAHVRDRALSLLQRVGGGTATAGGGPGVPIGVVLIVDPKQRARVTAQVDELLRTSGLPVKVVGTIADDPDGADLINGRGRGRLDRTLLIRSTREVALDLSSLYSTPSQGTAMSAPQGGPMPHGSGPMPQGTQQPQGMPPMAGPAPQQQYAAPPMPQPTHQPMPQPVSQPMAPPRGHQPTAPPHGQQPMAPPRGQQPVAPSRPPQPAPSNGYIPSAQNPQAPQHPSTPPVPQISQIPQPPQPPPAPGTAKQPMFRRGPQPQPTVWPGEQPPKPPPSAHEGFTSVTLGGGPDPRSNLQYKDDGDLDRLPPRTENNPGRGSRRAGPPQEGGQ